MSLLPPGYQAKVTRAAKTEAFSEVCAARHREFNGDWRACAREMRVIAFFEKWSKAGIIAQRYGRPILVTYSVHIPKCSFPEPLITKNVSYPELFSQAVVAALDLADALGTSPKLWMNLQVTNDLDNALQLHRFE